jgi:hypothetical protein
VNGYPPLVELEEMTSALARSLTFPQMDAFRPAWVWRHDTPKDRVTLGCGDCAHRIVWWTAELRSGWLGLQDANCRGWKWQGQEPSPVRFTGDLVHVKCGLCGWRKLAAARQPDPWWLGPPEIL